MVTPPIEMFGRVGGFPEAHPDGPGLRLLDLVDMVTWNRNKRTGANVELEKKGLKFGLIVAYQKPN